MVTLSFSIYPKDDAGEVNHESRSFQNSIAHQRYATRGNEGIELGVNDISLIFGGAYEFDGNWNLNRRHSFHRVGLSIDLDQTLTQEQLDQLTRFVEEEFNGVRHPERPQIHYSFNGAN